MTSSTPKLTDHKVLIFDVYGTLADWETGIYTNLKPLLSRYPASKGWSRKEALTAFGSVENDLQAQYPEMLYSDLLAKVHEVLEQRLNALSGREPNNDSTTLEGASTSSSTAGDATGSAGASTSSGETAATANPSESQSAQDEHVAFGNAIRDWPIFPDSPDALRRLSKYFKLMVLSNVDHSAFRYTHALLSEPSSSSSHLSRYSYPSSNPHKFWHPQETEGSKSPFTLVLTAQDTHCYKPALEGFEIALDCVASDPALLGALGEKDTKSKVLSVAQSLPHDHEPASRLGIRSVWIDRQSAVTCNEAPGGPGAPQKWTWRFETLGEMADAVEKELASS